MAAACGGRTSGQRVVGGSNANPFEFPWIVALVSTGTRKAICGGTLINSLYVVTAAHCFHETDRVYDVVVHAHDLQKSDENEKSERRSIVKIMCHRRYDHDM